LALSVRFAFANFDRYFAPDFTAFKPILRACWPFEIIAEKKAVHVQPDYQMRFSGARIYAQRII
jgi:hypothetical protein